MSVIMTKTTELYTNLATKLEESRFKAVKLTIKKEDSIFTKIAKIFATAVVHLVQAADLILTGVYTLVKAVICKTPEAEELGPEAT